MKLLLCSGAPYNNEILVKEFLNLLEKPAQENKMIILSLDITTEPWVTLRDKAKQTYLNNGFLEENLNTIDLSTGEIPNLDGLDVLHMWGGNPFHYLQRLREAGLDKEIRRFIDRGGVYVGTSAGSAIMCNKIDKNFTYGTNEGLKEVSGFGYLDFYLVCHWDTYNLSRALFQEKVIRYVWETCKRVVILTDNQAILVQDDGWKIITT